MALNKTQSFSNNVIEDYLEPEEVIPMQVNLDAMGHIVSRLTEIYPNPIQASVRELISNAVDATMDIPEADRKPIEVGVSAFDNNFTVRDYGVGMSYDVVKEMYSQYGGSAKENNFNSVGAYGLGAKAPLSYTDEFAVKTTQQGETIAFKLSRSTSGYNCKIIYRRKTSEADGTTVTVPFQSQDRQIFLDIANRYQKYSFDLPIKVEGVIENQADSFIEIDEVILDEESDTRGRIWLDLNEVDLSRLQLNHNFWLAGWVYSSSNAYYGFRSNVLVELKPGVVDFVSSRDDITRNERLYRLNDIVNEKLKDPELIVKIINLACEKYGYKVLSHFDENLIRFNSEVFESSNIHPIAREYYELANEPETIRGAIRSVFVANRARNKWSHNLLISSRKSYNQEKNKDYSFTEVMSPGFGNSVNMFSVIADNVISRKYYNRNFENDTIVHVTDVTDDNIKKIARLRSRFMNEFETNQTVTLMFTESGVSIPTLFEKAIDELNIDFIELTEDEFMTKARNHTPKAQASSYAGEIEPIWIKRPHEEMTRAWDNIEPDEITDNTIIIVGDGPRMQAVYALDNEGYDTESYKIIFTSKMTWTFFKALEDNSNVFFTQGEVNLKSKYLEEVAEKRIKFATIKNTTLDAITLENIYAYLSKMFSRYNYRFSLYNRANVRDERVLALFKDSSDEDDEMTRPIMDMTSNEFEELMDSRIESSNDTELVKNVKRLHIANNDDEVGSAFRYLLNQDEHGELSSMMLDNVFEYLDSKIKN